jgi:hypothetical protein
VVDSTMQTVLWSRVATSTDPGARIPVSTTLTTKMGIQLLAYSGASPTPVLAHAEQPEPGRSITHRTPTLTNTDPGAWLVSYWADKTATSTGWTSPTTAVTRQQTTGTGNGRITTLGADSATTVPTGTTGGLTATSTVSSDIAITWSVLLGARSP